ncbi:MAG: hypothetical protein KGR26_10600, partial [Cyanobacteria bacterium REEB65]|nr:hypothetical protein [Cyanobacteria bacterium REEB65]
METPHLLRKTALLLATAALGATGCATVAVFGGFSSLNLSSFLFLRSITVQAPGSPQQVTAFLFPLSNPKGITRQEFSAECAANPTASNCNQTFTGSQIQSGEFTDASLSADVAYQYTITNSDNSTQSRFVDPIDVQNGAVTLSGPGAGLLNLATGTSTPSVSGANLTFNWQPLASQSADLNYGFYILVGKVDTSSPTGIAPVYSAFLDAATHSTSVAFNTPSDLGGLTGELTGFLSGNKSTSTFAPATASSNVLAPGQYAWTVVTVVSNASQSIVPGNSNSPVIPPETSYGF